jgi:hypothetical protein
LPMAFDDLVEFGHSDNLEIFD